MISIKSTVHSEIRAEMIKKYTVLLTVLIRFLHNTGAAEAIEDWVCKLQHTAKKTGAQKLDFLY